MFSEWSRELLQESGTGKHLIIPTSSSAMKFERKALNNPMKLPIKAMNTEVEGKLQSFFFFFFFKKKTIRISPSLFVLQIQNLSIHCFGFDGMEERKSSKKIGL